MNAPHTIAARAAKRSRAESMGIDPSLIARLVHAFYARVRADPQIGPIFEARIDDWTPHLDQMERFWRSVLLNTGEFHGNPMLKHLVIPGLDRDHFVRWLTLFEETLAELATPEAQASISQTAHAIAASLMGGIERYRGSEAFAGVK
jgi:hemoglobin